MTPPAPHPADVEYWQMSQELRRELASRLEREQRYERMKKAMVAAYMEAFDRMYPADTPWGGSK